MTFQISTRKLLKTELCQNGWMLALSALGHFLLGPVLLLLYTSGYPEQTQRSAAYRFNNFFNSYYFPWQLFCMIVCITMCIYIYRYLFSKRMIDLYHSVPISRTQLFWVKYLHGLLIWILPFLLNAALVAGLSIFRLAGNPELGAVLLGMTKSILLILFCFFLFYHLFLTAVYLSGNILNMFANMAIIGLSAIGIYYLLYSYANDFFDTFNYKVPLFIEDILYALSPFAAPFGIYLQFSSGSLFTEHMLMLVLDLLVSIGLLLLARLLYIKRPSELAERGTLAKTYTIPARLLITFIAAVAGSLFFSEITYRKELAWGLFGTLLCAVLCFGAVNSIFHATIKAFFQYKRQMVFAVVLGIAVTLSFHLDLFGYDTYVPRQEQIAGMALKVYHLGDNTENYSLNKDGYITYTRNEYTSVPQEELITDPRLCYDLLNTFVYLDAEGTVGGYNVKVKLTNGRTYERSYTLANTHYEVIAPFVENEAFQDTYYKFRSGFFGYPDALDITIWNQQISSRVYEDQKERILDAYWQDFAEHSTLEELSSGLHVATLRGLYNFHENGDYNSFRAPVPDNYTRTLKILAELLPDYMNAAASVENIQKLHLYTPDLYDKEITMESLYEYFGYESAETADTDTTLSPLTPTASAKSIQTYPVSAFRKEMDITDPVLIRELCPLLYFGDYRDNFDKQEYILFGYIITDNNLTIDCYVKPGTLPEKWIRKLYENREEL